ncbi:MAG: hypothetical protein WD690_20485 [Vicinamibacterales bacterium]
MTRTARELAIVAAVAMALTAVIAAPVIVAPSDRIFGMPIAGYHHDPFTFMQQIDRPLEASVYLQPLTDIPAALAARGAGPVAAYNWLVLITFPLSAAAAYLLARHFAIAPVWAAMAALAFAFSPFHLSHAAYHPHIAQTQWMPLYLLALLRCLDNPTRRAAALVAASAAAVTLSNFYGGLIAALITPVVMAAHWVVRARFEPRPLRRVAVTTGSLALVASPGLASAWYGAPGLFLDPTAYLATPDELLRYGARWWSYLLPPVEHPALGGMVARVWNQNGVDVGLLEQQVSLGWGVVLLGVVGFAAGRARAGRSAWRSGLPILAAVAAAAFIWSLAAGPGAALHSVLPMFRSYARFGVVVQLVAVLLAGIGAQWLWGSGMRGARTACITLLTLAAAEYAVWPPAMSRTVLPTAAHRWVARHAGPINVLDCAPPPAASASIQWLTAYRVSNNSAAFDRCAEPQAAAQLAGAGYTHLIVRRESADAPPRGRSGVPDGLQLAAHFDDSNVYAIAALKPQVETVSMTAFHPREQDGTWSWRWIGTAGSWTIANRGGEPLTASLDVEMMAFRRARALTVLLNGNVVQRLIVDDRRGTYQIGPLALAPGEHQLTFRPDRPPSTGAPDSTETRALSLGFGGWQWIVHETHP